MHGSTICVCNGTGRSTQDVLARPLREECSLYGSSREECSLADGRWYEGDGAGFERRVRDEAGACRAPQMQIAAR
uniref:Uncharacterized protein n=1 Tax=Peronospora matthiolae TaxID=2874970 RepID=A0AAV1U506_9STRA